MMKSFSLFPFFLLLANLAIPLFGQKGLPEEMEAIMNLSKYEHAFWGIYVKDLENGNVLFEKNSNKLFSPASTTKLLTVAALLHTFGSDYRFNTPVYATQAIQNGRLEGDLVLIAKGDFIFGGRQSSPDAISFTKLDHINANEIPGVTLTSEDPLYALNGLAEQIYSKGLRELKGDVVIDDSLFETTIKRDMVLTPIAINENLIDLQVTGRAVGEKAELVWRPQAPGYEIKNAVTTVPKEGKLALEVTSDDSGHKLEIKGTIPMGEKNIVRTFSIKDPKVFAKAAFIAALKKQGIKITTPENTQKAAEKPFKPRPDLLMAVWTSPPLSEYAKLILKVSHNFGANMVPLLLAAKMGKRSFDEGMQLIGNFAEHQIGLSPDSFVLIDGAGGNENRLTLQAEVQLLSYMHKLGSKKFKSYFDALPILGVDGSLEDFGKKTTAVGKVRAKPGTGVAFNLATRQFFLITQAMAGYIEGKNGHLYAYEVIVNNAKMPEISDVFAIFEDESRLSGLIYDHTD